jgi:hypothetical protein
VKATARKSASLDASIDTPEAEGISVVDASTRLQALTSKEYRLAAGRRANDLGLCSGDHRAFAQMLIDNLPGWRNT